MDTYFISDLIHFLANIGEHSTRNIKQGKYVVHSLLANIGVLS